MEIQNWKNMTCSTTTNPTSRNSHDSNFQFSDVLANERTKAELKKDINGLYDTDYMNIGGNKVKRPYSIPSTADGVISIEDLRLKCAEMIDVFQKHTMKLFNMYGVDTSKEIQLQCSEDGSVIVSNDHPDKDKIEEIFADNPELSNLYRAVSATQSMLRAFEESASFRQRYAEDPEAAVEEYAWLFDNRRSSDNFTLSIIGEEIKISWYR